MFEERLALIIDSDPRSAKTAKEALESLCDDPVKVVMGLKEARGLVESKRVLFIVLDLDIDVEASLDFVKWLRKNTDNPNYKSPVVMITQNRRKMTEAIDAGITEFLPKPFSAGILKDLVISILSNPRNFIVLDKYVGPDRRTRNDNSKKNEKRKPQH
jgi:two-component system chemotaxis response regulator CheY